jgi:hypothetical protein
LDGNHFKFTTFPIIATTKTNIRRSVDYWAANGENGDTTFFCNVQTTKTIGTN